MSLDDILSQYFSPEEVSQLQDRYGIGSDLLSIAGQIQDISDSFQGHASYERAKFWVLKDAEMLKFGDFRANYRKMMKEYGGSNRERVLQAIDKQPAFGRRNHTKMIRRKRPLAETIYNRELTKAEMIDFLTKEGISIAGQSKLRDSAMIDVISEVRRKYGISPSPQLIFNSQRESPWYLIDDEKYTLSQARDITDLDERKMPNMYKRFINSIKLRETIGMQAA